jgi:enterochelin esterase-like enzyme
MSLRIARRTRTWTWSGLFLGLSLLTTTLTPAPAAAADEKKKDEPLTTASLREKLSAKLTADDAAALAEKVRAFFGKNNLAAGAAPKVDGLETAWAIEAPGATAAEVVSLDGDFRLALVPVGKDGLFAATVPLPDGAAIRWGYRVDGKAIPRPAAKTPQQQRGANQLEVYLPHPDSLERSDVPKGKLTQKEPWKSKVFASTTRDWWVYVPAQYKDDSPACVMVFQDGRGYKDFVPTVFDNLIAKQEMPVTVGIFIDPGQRDGGGSNRSFEYDTLSDQYARFLLEEILPEVEKTVKLRHDGDSRAIAGASSGGICAFTVAWERPDEFRKVLSWVGSFTNIASGESGRAGGHNYEAMIRKTPRKPIRVFLQDGSHDLDNNNGNWPLANQQMAKALEFAGYDSTFVYGQGFHSNRHGRAIMPDSLRWLWRDYKP